MLTFLYRCPTTGYNVQGHVADTVADSHAATDGHTISFHTVTCMACGRTHLVNPRTGKVAGLDQPPPV